MESVCDRLFKALEELKLSNYRVSKDTGVSEAILSNMKLGKTDPSISTVEKILNKYKVISCEYIFRGIGLAILNDLPNQQKIDNYSLREEILKIQSELNEVKKKVFENEQFQQHTVSVPS